MLPNAYRIIVLLLMSLMLAGCVSVPDQKGIWPWEYPAGKGEPYDTDFMYFRVGISEFGKAPLPAKPVTQETAEHSPNVGSAPAAPVPKKEPSVGGANAPEKLDITPAGQKDYDFKVGMSFAPSRDLLGLTTEGVEITAVNNGNAPVSVAVDVAENSAQRVVPDRRLPHFAVVPAKTERTLVQLSPKRKNAVPDVRYSYAWRLGDYRARHDCLEHYRFPFGSKVAAYAMVTGSTGATPYTRNAVIFMMPKGTQIHPARKGTVIRIGPGNGIDILHDDSTIGTYRHLEKVAVGIAVGKAVTTEAIIGTAGTAEDGKEAYIQLTVWRPEPDHDPSQELGVRRIGFTAASFPLSFSRSPADKGSVLTRNQPVPAEKQPAVRKVVKRK